MNEKAKEKANEIFDRNYILCTELNPMASAEARKSYSIKFSKNEIDEILKNIDASILYHKDSLALPINKEYWQEVRNQIELK